MELNIPGWMVSPRSLNNHMTAAHDRAAKTVKYRASGGIGFTDEWEGLEDVEYGVLERGIKEARTRETT